MRIKTCTSALAGLLWLLIPIGVWAQNAVLPPLNNPPSETGLPGKFIWADLFSADVDTAKRFYTGLFDWRWQAVDDNYSIAYSAEHPVAGLVFRAQQPGETARALWVHYASVRDVHAAAAAVEQQGGRIMITPKTVVQRGDYAIFSDRDGVLFGALHSLSGDPDDYQVPLGQWIWSQLVTADATRSADFYQSILGYDVYEQENAAKIDFILASNGYARAGITGLDGDSVMTKPAWVSFVRVSNIEQSVSQVRGLGGDVVLTPRPDVLDGKVAIISDPLGASVGLMDWQYPETDADQPR